MKKWLCLALAATLLLTGVPVCAAAETVPKAKTDNAYPVVLLPGLLENTLIRDKGGKDEEVVWFSLRNVLRCTVKYGAQILYTIYHGTDEQIASLTNEVIRDAVGGIRMNPDGTSFYNISTVVSKAEESSYAALKKNGMLRKVTYGPFMLEKIAETIGADRTFVFQYDWRKDPTEVAAALHDFIADVKRLTGSERVNAAGTSYGSTVLLTYLHEYGREGDLHRVLMNSPAYGGSQIFGEMMTAETPTCIDYEAIMNMIASNYGAEAEFGAIFRLIPQEVIDKIFQAAVRDFVQNDFIASVSFWGCCSPKDYEACKARFLDPVENAEVIRRADYMQHEIMENAGEILRGAADCGTQVFAVMNEGATLITHRGSGDVLVDAAGGTGGICLPVGEHFAENYSPAHIICKNEAHDHVSYSGSIDLTNAFLPEQTWVFYGEMHGQNYADPRARALTVELMTAENITDVYSDPQFPQFSENACPVSDISLTLRDSVPSDLDPAKGAVRAVVTNHSRRHCMAVREITLDGIPYTLSRTRMFLLPGQQVEITLTPTGRPSGRYGSVTIRYDEIPNLKIHKSRTQQFRIRNAAH